MTLLCPAPAGLIAYDFNMHSDGNVRARPVLALVLDGDTLAPCVLDAGQVRKLDPNNMLVGLQGEDHPRPADVAAVTEIGRLELDEKHPLEVVAKMLGIERAHDRRLSEHATDVERALNAHPIMRILGRSARDEMGRTSSREPDYFIVVTESRLP